MLPPLIVSEAKIRGIDLIAITDHNASANISAVQKAALGSGITVLPGMELQTKEEVHVICLFDTIEQIVQFQNIVDQKLPPIKNRPEFFGEQLVVDDKGDFVRKEERLLITSTDLSINEAYSLVGEIGGIFIPAHVNRKANGLLEILGFVPVDIPILALEISRHISPKDVKIFYPQINSFEIIQNGDVHRLSEFIGTTIFEIENPSISEIKLAIRKEADRSYFVNSIT
jgi:PHP family Zn ribbon phosphoesterase